MEKTVKQTKTHVAEKFLEGIGRRKTACARVRVAAHKGSGIDVVVNDKPLAEYFPSKKQQDIILAPFEIAAIKGKKMTVRVTGGGKSAQAEAIRLGASRAIIQETPEERRKLKPLGFLKRDPRMVERKKYGSRKARRPQQWRKR
jgi:small subunit ribosomal protein S9